MFVSASVKIDHSGYIYDTGGRCIYTLCRGGRGVLFTVQGNVYILFRGGEYILLRLWVYLPYKGGVFILYMNDFSLLFKNSTP